MQKARVNAIPTVQQQPPRKLAFLDSGFSQEPTFQLTSKYSDNLIKLYVQSPPQSNIANHQHNGKNTQANKKKKKKKHLSKRSLNVSEEENAESEQFYAAETDLCSQWQKG